MARKKSYQRGNVQEHPKGSGVWTLRYREFDHAARRWITRRERLGEFKNKKAARQAAEPIMSRVNERNNSPETARPSKADSGITFKQFMESRWKTYAVKHQPSTSYCYGSFFKKHLLPRFGDMRLRDITPGDISEFLEGLRKKCSASTLHVLYAMLKVFFNLALEYDLIDRSPVRPKLHRPKTVKVDKPTLGAAQIRAILEAMPEGDRLFVLLIAVTGMRFGEALALRWIDFNFAQSEIRVNHTLYRGGLKQPKSASSRRSIRLASSVRDLLAAHRERSDFKAREDFIFARPNGRALSEATIREHLYEAMNRAGISRVNGKHGFHIFRHSAGTLLYSRSRDLKLVQGVLGHSGISITSDIYVHLEDGVKAEGTEMLAEEILGNCDQTVTQASEMVS